MPHVKTAISLEPSLFDQLRQAAHELNMSRSRLIAEAVEEYLIRRRNRETLAQLNAVYAEEPDEEERAWLAHAKEQMRCILTAEDAQAEERGPSCPADRGPSCPADRGPSCPAERAS